MTSPPPPHSGPGLLQVLYDSVRTLEASVRELADEQGETKLLAERIRSDIAVIKTTIRHYDQLNEAVSDLKRKIWLIGLIGGMFSAIVTVVAAGMIKDAIATAPPPPREITVPATPKETADERP